MQVYRDAGCVSLAGCVECVHRTGVEHWSIRPRCGGAVYLEHELGDHPVELGLGVAESLLPGTQRPEDRQV